MFSTGHGDLSAAAAIFKNPVPVPGPRRNTACQQCRKRKLKCDSKRPCSTCVRSHTHSRTHGETNSVGQPECTYGDETSDAPQPASKVERLENRINELETLLAQMQVALESSQKNSSSIASSTATSPIMNATSIAPHDLLSETSNFMQLPESQSYFEGSFVNQQNIMGSVDATGMSQFEELDSSDFAASSSSFMNGDANALVPMSLGSPHSAQSQLLAMGWPQHLPDPETTRHLVQAFFAFHMHAGRLFHGPTFLASLDLHPSDPRFPFPAVLHAMCAVGSLYTADIPQPPMRPRSRCPQSGQYFSVDELFPGQWRQYERRPDSFAEQQAKFARLTGEAAVDRGEHLLECLQAHIILVWFYLSQARWSESFIAAGHALRCSVPCGLNMSAPFHVNTGALSQNPAKPPSILQDAQSVIDNEMRRNVFWIAYALERQQAAGNSFAMVLDDQDICQLLPLRADQFEQGISVPPEERQWSHDRKMLLVHPPSQTDAFILFIKSTILLSHVKNFSLRFRGRYLALDTMAYGQTASPVYGATDVDPRETQAFQALDRLVLSFRPSFPSHLRNPVQDEMVDPYLFAASSAAHLAQIILHEPHARMTNPNDVSKDRVITGARAILELMYAISSTSYDIALLDSLPILSWNCCGRVLVKALKMAVDTEDYEQSVILQAEIAYVHSMLAKAGERMPLAYRYKKMVYDFLANWCGRQFVETLPESSYHRATGHPLQANGGGTNVDDAGYMHVVYSPGTYPATAPSSSLHHHHLHHQQQHHHHPSSSMIP